MEVAPRCVATTVGLLSKVADGGVERSASGSGVVISADGLIMTAGHVISAPGTQLAVRFPNGIVAKGVALGMDHAIDTGLARITDPSPPGGWPFSPVAPVDSARVGEWVLATGNAGSIVVDRDPPLRLGRVTAHDSKKIDTNCALEPGDSGGPLFDLQGRVVGINSRIAASNSAIRQKEFLSTHVPVSLFNAQMKDLLASVNAHPGEVVGQAYKAGQPGKAAAGLQVERLPEAIKKLTDQKDPEVLQLMADAKKTGGKLQLTPQAIEHLIEKAGLAGQPSTRPAAVAATQPATPPSRGIAASQRAALLPQIKQALEAQFPGAKLNDEVLNRIMDHSTLTDGHLNLATSEEDLRDMGVKPGSVTLGKTRAVNRAVAMAGKTSLQTLALVAPSLQTAGDCVVEIRDGNKTALLGTIVDSNGYIVTKASDLPAHPTVVLADGRTLTPQVIGKDSPTDLALLKVAALGLTAANLKGSAPLGEWVTAPTEDPNEPAIGVVSHAARPIPAKFSHFAGEQKMVLGLGFAGTEPVVSMVSPGMPAEGAGLKVGDKVLELDGKPVKDAAEFLAGMKSHKNGDTITVKVHRGDRDLEFKPVLGKTVATTQLTKGIGETDGVAGGELSKRRTDFPMAIQTDVSIWADQIGGPLIDLQGNTVGVTIARYDRVCTFALPADLVRQTVAKLKAGAA